MSDDNASKPQNTQMVQTPQLDEKRGSIGVPLMTTAPEAPAVPTAPTGVDPIIEPPVPPTVSPSTVEKSPVAVQTIIEPPASPPDSGE